MAWGMFGKIIKWQESALILAATIATGTAVLVKSLVDNLYLDAPLYYYLSLPGSVLVVIIGGGAAARHSGHRLNQLRWFILFMAASAVVTVYILIIPRIVTLQASSSQLLLVRAIVHPLIWSIMTQLLLHTARHLGPLPDLMIVVFACFIDIYKSVFGRFLLLQLSGVGSVLLLNVLLALLDIVGRLASRTQGFLMLKSMYGNRTAEAISALPEMDATRLAMRLSHTMTDHAGIVAASAILSFARVSDASGALQSNTGIWVKAAAQIATTLITDFVTLAIDWKYHGIEYFPHWIRHMKRFMFWIMITITIGGLRLCVELLLLFCPAYHEGVGVVLQYCDKPSLFSALGY
ncbi:hypothetical protein WJX84_012114 [Apatococcus fuscideae]